MRFSMFVHGTPATRMKPGVTRCHRSRCVEGYGRVSVCGRQWEGRRVRGGARSPPLCACGRNACSAGILMSRRFSGRAVSQRLASGTPRASWRRQPFFVQTRADHAEPRPGGSRLREESSDAENFSVRTRNVSVLRPAMYAAEPTTTAKTEPREDGCLWRRPAIRY